MITVFAQGDMVFESDASPVPTEKLLEQLVDYLPADVVEVVRTGVEVVISLSLGESVSKRLQQRSVL